MPRLSKKLIVGRVLAYSSVAATSWLCVVCYAVTGRTADCHDDQLRTQRRQTVRARTSRLVGAARRLCAVRPADPAFLIPIGGRGEAGERRKDGAPRFIEKAAIVRSTPCGSRPRRGDSASSRFSKPPRPGWSLYATRPPSPSAGSVIGAKLERNAPEVS